MQTAPLHRHRLINALQTLLLLSGMAAILSALGWIVAGGAGILAALAGGLVLIFLNPSLSPGLVLRLYNARELSAREAPGVHGLLVALARRAELATLPKLYYVPSNLINAFTVGRRESAVIAVTDGLLRALGPRELCAVLAHETAHIRHNDIWVMSLADLFSRLTGTFAWIGQLLLLLNLPLVLLSEVVINWAAIGILIAAPALTILLQLALSRTREYDADLGAAELTSDPEGLAQALQKMERYQGSWLEQVLLPGRRVPDPSLLRTHPPTKERMRRLRRLAPRRDVPALERHARGPWSRPAPVSRAPRWHVHGLWY